VFSNFRQLVDLAEVRLRKARISYRLITGAVPHEQRGINIKEFQAGDAQIMLGTIQAGGIGVTLTAAASVVFLSRDRSAALNEQAICRCDRAGQTVPVSVTDIVARNTIDLKQFVEKPEMKWSWVLKMLGDIP
jgi:SNF2 family DNA or RNA helicase